MYFTAETRDSYGRTRHAQQPALVGALHSETGHFKRAFVVVLKTPKRAQKYGECKNVILRSDAWSCSRLIFMAGGERGLTTLRRVPGALEEKAKNRMWSECKIRCQIPLPVKSMNAHGAALRHKPGGGAVPSTHFEAIHEEFDGVYATRFRNS